MDEPCSLASAFESFDAHWESRVVAQINDYDVKIAKVAGEFDELSQPRPTSTSTSRPAS